MLEQQQGKLPSVDVSRFEMKNAETPIRKLGTSEFDLQTKPELSRPGTPHLISEQEHNGIKRSQQRASSQYGQGRHHQQQQTRAQAVILTSTPAQRLCH